MPYGTGILLSEEFDNYKDKKKMVIQLREIQEKVEELAPVPAAEDWDNPGLLLGSAEKEIRKALVALDARPEIVEEAVAQGVDMILTHHPVIFRDIKAVNDGSGQGRKLLKLLQNDISVYSMHTNFDTCPGGMGDIVCERLGLEKLGPLEPSAYDASFGLGFVAELSEEMSARELSKLVKERFGLPYVLFYDAGKGIRRIACCPGSGKGELSAVLKTKVDAFLTGDMGHHEGLDYMEEGISLIDAGHYGLEHIFVPYMADFLRKHFPELTVLEEGLHFPTGLV